jgi:hypothetical protein
MIQLAVRSSVQPARDEWVRPGDERPAAATSGGNGWTDGADAARRCARLMASSYVWSRRPPSTTRSRARATFPGVSAYRIISGNRCFGTSPAASWWWRCRRSVRGAAMLLRGGVIHPVAAGAAFVALGVILSASWRWNRDHQATSGSASTAARLAGLRFRLAITGIAARSDRRIRSARSVTRLAPSQAGLPLNPRAFLSRARGYFDLVLSGSAGRATPQGSYFSLGSGMRSSAAL